MRIQISNLLISYDEMGEFNGVEVHFHTYSDKHSISINGPIKLTAEEYEQNIGMLAIAQTVREKLSTIILEDLS